MQQEPNSDVTEAAPTFDPLAEAAPAHRKVGMRAHILAGLTLGAVAVAAVGSDLSTVVSVNSIAG